MNGKVTAIVARYAAGSEFEVCLGSGELTVVAVHDPLWEIQIGDALDWDDVYAKWTSHYDIARGVVYMAVRSTRHTNAWRRNAEKKQKIELEVI